MSVSGSDSSSMDGEEVMRAFWGVELEPGKQYTSVAAFDLHITSAVLPASAKDNGRSVVSLTFDEAPTSAISVVSLKLDHNESQLLNVMIDEGSEFKFTVSGKNHVHLSGFYTPNESPYDDDDEIDSDMGEDEFDESMLESDNDEEELSDSTKDKTKNVLALLQQNQQDKKRKADQGMQNGDNKKAKAEQHAGKAPNTPAAKPAQQEGKKAQTPQQQQKPQQQKTPQQQQKPQQGKSPQQGQKTPQQQELAGGLKYTVTTPGNGAEATFGRKVSMRYVGKFTKSGKVFDKADKKPFSFRLGAGDVIKGWDKGIIGMKEGEKRTLVIPPELGYGKQGAGKEIPPNSWLTFDVELVTVK